MFCATCGTRHLRCTPCLTQASRLRLERLRAVVVRPVLAGVAR